MRAAAALSCLLLAATGCFRHVEAAQRFAEGFREQPATVAERSESEHGSELVGPPAPPREQLPPRPPSLDLEPVLDTARALLGHTAIVVEGKRYPSDCSNFVRAVYSVLGVDLWSLGREVPGGNGVRIIERFVERYGERPDTTVPLRGDLVFFDDTYDRNRNGRLDDPLTHIGVVDAVEPDGTIYVLHRSRHGIVREAMNLLHPTEHTDATGRVVNDYLRAKTRRDPPGARHLMGELFAGFGRLSRLPDGVDPSAAELVQVEPDEPGDEAEVVPLLPAQ